MQSYFDYTLSKILKIIDSLRPLQIVSFSQTPFTPIKVNKNIHTYQNIHQEDAQADIRVKIVKQFHLYRHQ